MTMKFSRFGVAFVIWVCPKFTNPKELGEKHPREVRLPSENHSVLPTLGRHIRVLYKVQHGNISVMLVIKSAIQCTWSRQMFTFLIVTELFRSVPCYHCVNDAL